MSDQSHELWIEHQNRLGVIDSQQRLAWEMLRPFYLAKPQFMGIDGDHYWFLYGLNIQEGCAGFGRSMEEASLDFDKNWSMELPKAGIK